MDSKEREIIDGLFGRLRQAETQSGMRDREAEGHIAELVRQQPAAPYYMTQAIVVQEQALQAAQQRIQQLEHELSQRPAGGGGFLSSLFGGNKPAAPAPTRHQPMTMPTGGQPGYGNQGYGNQPWGQQSGPMAGASPWGRPAGYHGGGGGGFMAGAMQTAVGVAGGVLVGNMIADMLSPDAAQAAEAPPEPANEPADEPAEDYGGDDFSMGDEEI